MSKTPEQILKKWYTPLHGIGELSEIQITEAMKEYAKYQTQELQEQNAELLRTLQSVYNLLNVDAKISVDSIKGILTKHNHLNQNP